MSRLLIKNLPVYTTPQRLRQHFTQAGCPPGTITDIKVAQKSDGTSRRFGFVGYKTEEEAGAAREWFDRTFIDSARLNVMLVNGAKDAPTPRPNKRPRLGPSPAEENTKSKSKKAKITADAEHLNPNAKQSDLDAYISLSQSRNKAGPIWANDAAPLTSAKSMPKRDVSEDVVMEDDPKEVNEGPVSDLDWMRARMSKRVDDADNGDGDEESPADSQAQISLKEEEEDPTTSAIGTIRQTSRLFLRNLAYSCTEEELQAFFAPYGNMRQVHIPLDPKTSSPKGMAYITFTNPDSAVAAYQRLDKQSFQGRLLHILPAVDRRGNYAVEEAEDGRKKTVKEEREAKRKKEAGKDWNWGMLYMNSDAVASSIADRMGISKADILNPSSDDPSDSAGMNPAVKLALAETHIIQETKAYLESQGVDLASPPSATSSSSQMRRKRSNNIILVKNIPYSTSSTAITELFEPHGTLERVIVPPAGTIAIVQFKKGDEAGAKKAFGSVVYRRMGSSVLYLEWGWEGMIREQGTSAKVQIGATTGPQQQAPPGQEKEKEESLLGGGEEEPSIGAGSTLYIKNLAFSTTTERLIEAFSSLPGFAFARVQTKPNPNPIPAAKGDSRLSMGYGFVGFKDLDSARTAMKGLQKGYLLDGRELNVSFAGRGRDDDVGKSGKGGAGKGGGTKMIVKNVPFEASKKDLRALFGAHGTLKSLRLPQKFGSRSRGFAFLEYTTRREAEHAYETLRYTHLLGRHLVLEWAEVDDEGAEGKLEELRRKTGVGYGDGKEMPGKKGKVKVGEKRGGDGDEDELEG